MKTKIFMPFLLGLFIISIPIAHCRAQSDDYDPQNYKIKKILNPDYGAIKMVQFIDKRTDEIVNTYEVEKNDPYIAYGFERIKLNDYHLTFKLPEEVTANRSHEFRTANLKLKNNDSIVEPPVNFFTIRESVRSTKKFVIVSYSFQAYNGKPDLSLNYPYVPVGGNSTVLIFDKKGELLHTIKDLGVYTFSTYYLSKDGKYLSFTFGTGKAPDGAFYLDKTLRVIDAETGRTVFNGPGVGGCLGRSQHNSVFYYKSNCKTDQDAIFVPGINVVNLNTGKYYYKCLEDHPFADMSTSLSHPTLEGISMVQTRTGERLKFFNFNEGFQEADLR